MWLVKYSLETHSLEPLKCTCLFRRTKSVKSAFRFTILYLLFYIGRSGINNQKNNNKIKLHINIEIPQNWSLEKSTGFCQDHGAHNWKSELSQQNRGHLMLWHHRWKKTNKLAISVYTKISHSATWFKKMCDFRF